MEAFLAATLSYSHLVIMPKQKQTMPQTKARSVTFLFEEPLQYSHPINMASR